MRSFFVVFFLVGSGFWTGIGMHFFLSGHAAKPAHAQPAAALDCSQAGDVGQIDDGHGALLLNWGPCTVVAGGKSPVHLNATLQYTLKNPINAWLLDAWIGTQTGSKMEAGYYSKITTPDGRQGIFVNQYDKHMDVVGSSPPHQWELPFNLPAGTQIEIGLALGVANPEVDCPCGIQAQWTLNSGFE